MYRGLLALPKTRGCAMRRGQIQETGYKLPATSASPLYRVHQVQQAIIASMP